jgi:hypothetical protein
MAREHIHLIHQWCDRHLLDEDVQVPGTEVIIGLDRAGWTRVDLCEDCQAALVAPLRALAEKTGVPVNARGDELGAPAGTTSAPRALGGRPASYACLFCESGFTSPGGMTLHFKTAHGASTKQAEIFGSRCPLDGTDHGTFQGLTVHTRQMHPEVTTVSRAFELADARGDEHHVVAARRALALNAAP